MKTLLDLYKENDHLDACDLSTEILKQYTFPEEADVSIGNPDLRKAIFEVFNGKCPNTGHPIEFDEMVIDHIIPKSLGGPDNIYNYSLSLSRPNLIKSDFLDPNTVIGLLYITRIKAQKVLDEFNKNKAKKEDHKPSPEEIVKQDELKKEKSRRWQQKKKHAKIRREEEDNRKNNNYLKKVSNEIIGYGAENIVIKDCPLFEDDMVVLNYRVKKAESPVGSNCLEKIAEDDNYEALD